MEWNNTTELWNIAMTKLSELSFLFNHWIMLIIAAITYALFKNKKAKGKIDAVICSIVGRGISSNFIALITLVFGALFSVFSSELKSEMQNGAGITVSSSFIGIILLFLMLKKNDETIQRDINNKEERLDSQIMNLKTHLSNMPPRGVLTHISQHIIFLNEKVIQSDTFDSEEKIKTILTSIVKLAKLWDGYDEKDDTVNYNVNLMILLDSKALKSAIENGEDEYRKAIETSPFFLYSDNVSSCLDNCDAILFTKREYSVSTNENKNIDDDTPCMCLPVTLEMNSNIEKQPNIFGAPASVETKKAIYIPDTSEALRKFIAEAESSCERFSKKFRTSLESYYNKRKASIYSIPLIDQDKIAFSVVNIYQTHIESGNKMILRSEEHARSFYHLIAPICNMLVQVLKEIESEIEPSRENSKESNLIELQTVAGG